MGNKLLLADDSITIQKVVGIIFANEDYELTVVDNGNAALDKARELLPDIILVDALMPGKTGYEVCEAVRREPSLRHVPLLLLTGAFEPFDEGKARESGADDFISKPFESQHLIDKVKTLIELGKERRAGQSVLPAAEPVATPPVQPAVTPAAVEPLTAATAVFAAEPEQAPAAAAGMEEMLFADLDVSAETAPLTAAVSPAEATVEAELVEVSPDDDLWGAFDLEELPEESQVEFGTVIAEETAVAEEVAVADEFVFAEEAEVGTIEASTVLVEPAGDIDGKWLPVEEQTFDFQEEEGFPEESMPEADPFAELAAAPEAAAQDEMAEFLAEPAREPMPVMEQPFAPEEESVPAPAPAAAPPQEMDLQFAPEEEYVPFVPPGEAEAPSVAAVAATAAAAVATASAVAPASAASAPAPAPPAELSEEQLTALVAKISKDIIERIAWEVVPDLAENIIKEEVRRLKEGA